jgi:hypothetical protein
VASVQETFLSFFDFDFSPLTRDIAILISSNIFI